VGGEGGARARALVWAGSRTSAASRTARRARFAVVTSGHNLLARGQGVEVPTRPAQVRSAPRQPGSEPDLTARYELAGMAHGGSERRGPAVLPHQDCRRAAGPTASARALVARPVGHLCLCPAPTNAFQNFVAGSAQGFAPGELDRAGAGCLAGAGPMARWCRGRQCTANRVARRPGGPAGGAAPGRAEPAQQFGLVAALPGPGIRWPDAGAVPAVATSSRFPPDLAWACGASRPARQRRPGRR